MDILKAKRAEELFVEDEPGKGLSTNDYTNEDKQLVQDAERAASTAAAAVVELDTRMTTAESEIDTLQTTVAGIETLLASI